MRHRRRGRASDVQCLPVIIECADGGPNVVDVENLRALSVVAHGPVDLGALGEFDGTHAWVRIDALRRAARSAGVPDGWEAGFDDMVVFARSKGWVSDDGDAVRVHVETPG